MDITPLFKASVKTVRTRNKALGINKSEDPNRIFPRVTKDSSKFQTKAKDIVSNVTKLNDFLIDNKRSYLDTGSLQLFSQGPKLSQADRSELDSTIQFITKTCFQQIQELKQENASIPANPQTREHRQIVLNIVEAYFKSVCKMYQEIKEQYQKRKTELEKVTKLEGDALKKMSFSSSNG